MAYIITLVQTASLTLYICLMDTEGDFVKLAFNMRLWLSISFNVDEKSDYN